MKLPGVLSVKESECLDKSIYDYSKVTDLRINGFDSDKEIKELIGAIPNLKVLRIKGYQVDAKDLRTYTKPLQLKSRQLDLLDLSKSDFYID